MPPKKILVAASNSWNSIFQVGTHHLAREFLKMGYEVAFISDPISPFHIKSPTLYERLAPYRSGGIREQNLWTYVPFTLFPPHNKPILRSEWIHRHWHQWTIPSVVKKVHQNGFGKVDILYLDTPLQSFWLNSIQAKKTVYRMADKNSGFKKSTPTQLQMEQELIQQVDCVVYTAKPLADSIPRKAHYLPNGVPFAHFAKPGHLPSEYKNIPKPIAVYVGAIEYWFDFGLVEQLAKNMPDVSFVCIGPAKEQTSTLKNVHFLGPRPYSEVPNYLQFANVGLIPFDVKHYPDLIHNVNPLKLYEYMASGLPVVSTRWKEIENIASPAHLCNTLEDFESGIRKALKSNGFTEQNFAKSFDWSTRAAQLLNILGEL